MEKKGKEEQEKNSCKFERSGLNRNRVQRARFPFKLKRVLWARFLGLRGQFVKLSYWCNGKSSAIYSIYTPKSCPLDLIC